MREGAPQLVLKRLEYWGKAGVGWGKKGYRRRKRVFRL